MSLKDFFIDIDDEVKTVVSSNFEIEIIDTKYVPSFDDSNITFDNLDKKIKKCKRLQSCVLYVDMRDSTQISASKKTKTLAKIYSSFVKSMLKAARYYDGHVRNIIGDRVMVVFDQEDCFKNAVDTAILINSINEYILNKHIKSINFKCGIGIDYGTMLITKAGAIKRNSETEFYRSLVWLGKPANIASKLTDVANKQTLTTENKICQGNYYKSIDYWVWLTKTYDQFIDDLIPTYSRNLKHKDENFCSFFKTINTKTNSASPILMTEEVYNGFLNDCPDRESIQNGWWKEQSISIKDYPGKIMGGDIICTAVKEI